MAGNLPMGQMRDTGLPYLEVNGEKRILAALPPQRTYAFPKFGDRYPVIPRGLWGPKSFRPYVRYQWDQNGQGSCVGHGSTAAISLAKMFAGQDTPKLSPCMLYSQINGGRDNGAVVGDALEALKTKGVCLESEVGPKQIWTRDVPASAWQTAQRFKVDEAIQCDSFDELVSALLRGQIVSFGIEIGQNFEPNHFNGVIPPRSGRGGGHCLCGIGVSNIGGQWYLETQNSWGTDWGQNGFCFIPENYFSGEYGHFAILCSNRDPQEPNVPPNPQ